MERQSNKMLSPLSLLIKHCITSNLLYDGRLAHSSFLQHGPTQDHTLVQNLLIQMYSKCDGLDDACATFQAMEDHNVFSWTILMGAYADHGYYEQVLFLFKRMLSSGITPNRVTLITIVSACANMGNIVEGKLVHSCIETSPCDITLGNALVSMYDKCGSIANAYLVFGRMPQKNAISWNSMIASYAHHGHGIGALQFFHQMLIEDLFPDKVSFVNVLDVYADYASLVECKRMHVRVMVSGFESDVVLATAVVCMYGKHGSMDNAWIMFDYMPDPNIISWNAILASFEEHRWEKDVIQLFQQMQLRGLVPDKVTCVTVFTACASSLKEGKRLHSCIQYSGLCWDLILWNALINMYGDGGMLNEALALFEETPTRDVVSWNGVIAALAHHECGNQAIQLFQQMQLECVVPNKVTLVSTIDACASEVMIAEGKRVHARIMGCGFEGEVAENNAILNMYGKCGRVEHARKMFDTMDKRDVISWSSLAAAYTQHGYGSEAMHLFDQMQIEGVLPNKVTYVSLLDACASQSALAEGKVIHTHIHDGRAESDLVVGNALMNMYSKCHSLMMARKIFDGMQRRDVVSWTAMSSAYAQEGYQDVALQLFFQMQDEGVYPNNITFISILDAFGNQAALIEGHAIHAHIVETEPVEVDLEVGNAIVSLYGKCGCLEDAHRVFDRMPEKNVITWTTMISSYSQYGMGKKAYKLYQRMQGAGMKPNRVTLLSVLTACSHAGLIEEGCLCFHMMCHEHDIAPTLEHYNCMVDLFTRAGKVEEGINVIHKMPMGPVATTWMTVLGACKMHLDLERAMYAAEKVFELDPKNATPYVLLSNIFAEAGRCEDAEHIRAMILEKGLKKPLGCSSIIVEGKTYEFHSGDDTHPRFSDICIELENLYKQMKEEGYVTNTNLAVQEEEEEEEDVPYYYHSEKLAIAFGLISTPPWSPLVIRRNLRICQECHSTIKYISRVTQRQIVVSDGHFAHRFKGGMCTCSDDS